MTKYYIDVKKQQSVKESSLTPAQRAGFDPNIRVASGFKEASKIARSYSGRGAVAGGEQVDVTARKAEERRQREEQQRVEFATKTEKAKVEETPEVVTSQQIKQQGMTTGLPQNFFTVTDSRIRAQIARRGGVDPRSATDLYESWKIAKEAEAVTQKVEQHNERVRATNILIKRGGTGTTDYTGEERALLIKHKLWGKQPTQAMIDKLNEDAGKLRGASTVVERKTKALQDPYRQPDPWGISKRYEEAGLKGIHAKEEGKYLYLGKEPIPEAKEVSPQITFLRAGTVLGAAGRIPTSKPKYQRALEIKSKEEKQFTKQFEQLSAQAQTTVKAGVSMPEPYTKLTKEQKDVLIKTEIAQQYIPFVDWRGRVRYGEKTMAEMEAQAVAAQTKLKPVERKLEKLAKEMEEKPTYGDDVTYRKWLKTYGEWKETAKPVEEYSKAFKQYDRQVKEAFSTGPLAVVSKPIWETMLIKSPIDPIKDVSYYAPHPSRLFARGVKDITYATLFGIPAIPALTGTVTSVGGGTAAYEITRREDIALAAEVIGGIAGTYGGYKLEKALTRKPIGITETGEVIYGKKEISVFGKKTKIPQLKSDIEKIRVDVYSTKGSVSQVFGEKPVFSQYDIRGVVTAKKAGKQATQKSITGRVLAVEKATKPPIKRTFYTSEMYPISAKAYSAEFPKSLLKPSAKKGVAVFEYSTMPVRTGLAGKAEKAFEKMVTRVKKHLGVQTQKEMTFRYTQEFSPEFVQQYSSIKYPTGVSRELTKVEGATRATTTSTKTIREMSDWFDVVYMDKFPKQVTTKSLSEGYYYLSTDLISESVKGRAFTYGTTRPYLETTVWSEKLKVPVDTRFFGVQRVTIAEKPPSEFLKVVKKMTESERGEFLEYKKVAQFLKAGEQKSLSQTGSIGKGTEVLKGITKATYTSPAIPLQDIVGRMAYQPSALILSTKRAVAVGLPTTLKTTMVKVELPYLPKLEAKQKKQIQVAELKGVSVEQKAAEKTMLKQVQIFSESEKTKQRRLVEGMQITLPGEKTTTRTTTHLLTGITPIEEELVTVAPPIYKLRVGERQALKLKTTTMAKTKTATMPPAQMLQLPIPEPERPRPTITLLPPIDKGTIKLRKAFEKGFRVYAKRYGKMFELTKKPVGKKQALSLGGKWAAETAGVTFKLKPTKQFVKKQRRSQSEWNKIKKQFYRKGQKTYVERTKFRIDAPGELEEITYKGLLSLKQRKKLLGGIGLVPQRTRKRKKRKGLLLF